MILRSEARDLYPWRLQLNLRCRATWLGTGMRPQAGVRGHPPRPGARGLWDGHERTQRLRQTPAIGMLTMGGRRSVGGSRLTLSGASHAAIRGGPVGDPRRELDAVVQPQLGEGVEHVVFDGPLGEVQLAGDLGVSQPLGDQG